MSLKNEEQHSLTSISLFSGAGGLDIGMEQAGFSTLSAVEICPDFSQTLRLNQSKGLHIDGTKRKYLEGTQILTEDIRNISASDLNPKGIEIDCLVGGPPCQAFSSAGKQESIFDNRGALVYQYLRMLKEIQPRTFIFENVRGLVTARGMKGEPGEVLHELLRIMRQIGYSSHAMLLNSADFGSYQRRVRCFIIGSRIGNAPETPLPTHGKEALEANLFSDDIKPWRTLRDFLSSYEDKEESHWCRPTESLWIALKDLPNGSGLKSSGRPEATRPNGHWGYRQGTFIADLDKPARTVTGSSSQDWIRMADHSLRRLTLREVALLQGFPEDWTFCGSKAHQFQQVGNAVPTIFGKTLGKVIADYLRERDGKTMLSGDVESEVDPMIMESIRYTKYDNSRNGSYRVNRISSLLGSTP
ncbi:MAG: DNA cytosine methyltransferase [Bacteroidales bacterium]|nr:DNA cytosine methyltransferase [Bacteroidales bacterium]